MSEKRFVIGDDNIAMFEVIDMEKEELVCECRAVDVETLVDLLNNLAEENEQLRYVKNNCRKQQVRQANTIHKLIEENERLKNKLNVAALELVDESISMGKAVEISEMNYHEFLEYRQKKGKPMELQR